MTLSLLSGRAPIAATLARWARDPAPCADVSLPLRGSAPERRGSHHQPSAPERIRAAVAAAVADPVTGGCEKVVLAREVASTRPERTTPGRSSAALRSAFPSCFCFCCGTPEGAFLGASPELLIRRAGPGPPRSRWRGRPGGAPTRPSTTISASGLLHSAKDRAEHEIVVRRIEQRAAPARGVGGGRARAGAGQGREHPTPGDPDPRAARAAALGRRARRHAPPDAGGRRRAARGGARGDRASSRVSTGAGTRGRSGGWTRPRMASSASGCGRRSCATAPRTCSPARASSPTPTLPPSWPRPSSSWRAAAAPGRVGP